MSAATVITRGYGVGGSAALVITRGYGVPVPAVTTGGGGRRRRIQFPLPSPSPSWRTTVASSVSAHGGTVITIRETVVIMMASAMASGRARGRVVRPLAIHVAGASSRGEMVGIITETITAQRELLAELDELREIEELRLLGVLR